MNMYYEYVEIISDKTIFILFISNYRGNGRMIKFYTEKEETNKQNVE